MKLLIVFASILAMGSAQIVMSGVCSDVDLVKDFDVPRYTGKWFETYRYEHENQIGGDCATAQYTLVNDEVQVLNSMVVQNNQFIIKGTVAPAPDANGEGKLIVSFPTTNNTNSDYWVLNTDYDSYALVYACTNLPNSNKRVSSWILSRNESLSPQAVLALTPTIEATPGLFWDVYRRTSQSTESCDFNNTIEIRHNFY